MGTDFSNSFKTRVITCFATIALVFVFAPLLFPSIPAPYWFHDHFFNTLKIAENFRTKGFPTFDGVTPTNDFSLLWGLTLSGLSALVSSETAVFFILVRLLLGLALCLSLWLFNRLIDALDLQPEKETRFLTSAFLAAFFLYTALSGSDAALAIPCFFAMALSLLKALEHPSFASGIILGLTVSLSAFTRFDCGAFFLTAVLVFYFQFNSKYPLSKKQALILLAGIIAGLIPLMVYADTLQTKFGSPVPAELLSWGKTQDIAPWRLLIVLFFEPLRYVFQMPQAVALVFFPSLLLPLVAYVSFPWLGKEQKPRDTVFYTLIWYPILYLTALAGITFITLPEYAFYPLAAGAPIALLFATRKINSQLPEEEKKLARRAWLILGGLLLLICLTLSIKPRSAFLSAFAQTFAEFAGQHPGRYAMSSGAGMISFMTKADIVRLDGMAEDQNLLNMLEKQEDLGNAFKHYKIDYYVAFKPQKDKECYSAREPVQNRFGGTNKGLSDWLCAAPVFEKQITPKTTMAIFKIDEAGKAAFP